MAETSNNKPAGPAKSFMTAGPTLHYSHANVHSGWGLSLVVYAAVCLFWARLINGQVLVLNLLEIIQPRLWDLGRVVTHPLSIYEYPWHITVLGAAMGILTVSPLLTSQLLSFRYSVPMILSVVFLARLPLLGVFLLVSCVAVACRPLRFRSRIIALALCMAPPMVYWALFGGIESSDPIRWGVSYAPWIYAWLTSLFIAGIVIAVGHYTRYRPSLVWVVTLVTGLATFLTFHLTIGFAELDYQMYAAGNNPEEQIEFHDHSLTQPIDAIIADPMMYSYLAGYFYPTDKIELRKKLKEEIENLLYYNRWPQWFSKSMPEELKYQSKRSQLLAQYNYFIEKRPASRRVPTALYYKALLNEYSPDARYFGHTEILRFYMDYPFYENLHIWQDLLIQFPDSPEALEARWRIAVQEAGNGRIKEAIGLCEVDLALLEKTRATLQDPPSSTGSLLAVFVPPAQTAMTRYKLQDLRTRLLILKETLSPVNQGTAEETKQRLARFVILNPYSRNYAQRLEELQAELSPGDPLEDNVLLARCRLIPDLPLRAKSLLEISEKFPAAESGIQALYELGTLRVQQWKEMKPEDQGRQAVLGEARQILTRYIETYPQGSCAEPALRLLASLPNVE